MSEIITIMSKDEALDWKFRIKTEANSLRILINDGYERKAWQSLGFKNWTECVRAISDEFDISERRIWQLQAANETEKLLNQGSVGNIPEKQLRPLTSLEPEEQREAWQRVIEKAPPTGITAAIVLEAAKEIQQEKRDERRAERIEKLVEISSNNKPLEGIGKFQVLLCDPPWQYDFPISDSRRIENQYPTMSIDEICDLKVADICTDDAIIFLWSPPSFIHKGLRVLSAWGFDFRTTMVWVKPSIGPGQWVRQRHEMILIGVKGNIPTPRGEDKPDSVIQAPREEHSKKPEVVYEIIEKMYPELRKVELFSRSLRAGWFAWGNQA